MSGPSCVSCRWFHHQSGRCGAFDLPAELSRARPALCGMSGSSHSERPGPFLAFVESWWSIGVAAAIVLLLGFILFILPRI